MQFPTSLFVVLATVSLVMAVNIRSVVAPAEELPVKPVTIIEAFIVYTETGPIKPLATAAAKLEPTAVINKRENITINEISGALAPHPPIHCPSCP